MQIRQAYCRPSKAGCRSLPGRSLVRTGWVRTHDRRLVIIRRGVARLARVHHLVPRGHDLLGITALVHAAEPSPVIERHAQLLVADAVVLAYLHRHAATRATVPRARNDDCFSAPAFWLILLLSRRFRELRFFEPSRRGVVLQPLLFIHDAVRAAIPHAPFSIRATPVHLVSHVVRSSFALERTNKNRSSADCAKAAACCPRVRELCCARSPSQKGRGPAGV
jgi:hypothetical protein